MIDYNNLKEVQVELTVEITEFIPVGEHGIKPESIPEIEQLSNEMKKKLESEVCQELCVDKANITSYKCFLHEKEN